MNKIKILISVSSFIYINNILPLSFECCGNGQKELNVIKVTDKNEFEIENFLKDRKIYVNNGILKNTINYIKKNISRCKENISNIPNLINNELKNNNTKKNGEIVDILKKICLSYDGEEIYLSDSCENLKINYEKLKNCSLWEEESIVSSEDDKKNIVLIIAYKNQDEDTTDNISFKRYRKSV